jgi:hypothetical protein
LKTDNYNDAINDLGIDNPELIVTISRNLSALAQEGILSYPMQEINIANELVNKFYRMLKRLFISKDEKERRRFRRVILPERIVKLAEIVYKFSSENQFLKR